MMLNGLFNEEATKAQHEVDAADDFDFDAQVSVLSDDFIERIKKCLEEFDENAFLYLGGYVELPEIGDTIVANRGDKYVECVVDAINLHEAIVYAHYLANAVYYFNTAENAANYTNTGNMGEYNSWLTGKTSEYQHKGEHLKTYKLKLPFADI